MCMLDFGTDFKLDIVGFFFLLLKYDFKHCIVIL